MNLAPLAAAQPTASFAGCHYNGHSRAFTIQLANVPLADSALLASIIAVWTDPALEPPLPKSKPGTASSASSATTSSRSVRPNSAPRNSTKTTPP